MNTTVQKSREYKKLDSYSRQTIDLSIDKLRNRYKTGLDNKADIFDDYVLTHYVIDNEFYVYRTHTRDVQVRLLYVIKKGKIDVLDYCIKNRDNMKTNIGRYNVRYVDKFKSTVKRLKKEWSENHYVQS